MIRGVKLALAGLQRATNAANQQMYHSVFVNYFIHLQLQRDL